MLIQRVIPEKEPVIKGSRDGLRIILPVHEVFEASLEALANNLSSASGFFRGAKAILEPSRELAPHELGLVEKLLSHHGLELGRIRPVPARVRVAKPGESPKTFGEQAMIVRHTVRSGQRIECEGSVTVLGDVNPGGEIVATGDIAIFGSLRGFAHAGAAGDQRAVVVALSLRPVQLRIGDRIARPPDSDDRNIQPEIARIRNGQIVVEPYRELSRRRIKTHRER